MALGGRCWEGGSKDPASATETPVLGNMILMDEKKYAQSIETLSHGTLFLS